MKNENSPVIGAEGMIKVLVVGAGSYIGENFVKYTEKNFYSAEKIEAVDIVDSFTGWKQKKFEDYDSVIFVAGIAHRKQTLENKNLYFQINRDLAVQVAKKAKSAKVPQFVYLSSMAVYGLKQGEISCNTKPNPRHNDYYGTSKLEAEDALIILADYNFKLAIIRPPMVYGENCPGKFGQLVKIAKYFPIVPCNGNERSLIYIDNLSEFLCTAVTGRLHGVFHPQDSGYASTAGLIKKIRRQDGKKTVIIGMKFLIFLCMLIFPQVKTAFASLYYSKEIV